ncbi:MAG: alpha-L-rhamnosidase C-terminal domain-containing protein [bacterium]
MPALQPTGLMVNLLARPERAVVTTSEPRFSWIVNASHPGAIQQGARILVASSLERLVRDEADVWDSGEPGIAGGWTTDARSVAVAYEGPPLAPHTEYWWKVRTWLSATDASPWSQPQRFVTGDLTDAFTVDHYAPQAEVVRPTSFVRRDDGTVFVDFGRAAFATLRLTVDVPEPTALTVRLGEVRAGDYEIDRAPGGSRRCRVLTLDAAPGRHTYQLEVPPDDRNTGPYAVRMPADLFEVTPFRYCEIEGAGTGGAGAGPTARGRAAAERTAPATLTSADVEQLALHYPFDDEAASFRSSNAVLNDVWDFCRYSIKATSFLGVYVDGDRERIPYESDGYIDQLGHFACDREYTMSRRSLEHLVYHPTWPTEWHLYLVLAAWNDYLYTGDDRFIAARYDELVAKSLASLADGDGLISLDALSSGILESIHFDEAAEAQFPQGVRDVVDWPQVERDGHEMLPVNSVPNALHYRALRALARTAAALGKQTDAKRLDDRAAAVRTAFARRLVDSSTGLVLDGEGSAHSSLHANMFALASGVLAEESVAPVARHVRSRGMACSVYGSQMLLEALYAAGEDDYALSLLAGTGLRSWAHMIYDVGSTISLEAWDDSIKPNQDWNHAWGAAPANAIPFGLMGVRPLEPGWARAIVDPRPGSLAWAESRVPTVRGAITVRVTNTGGLFSVEVDVPANMTVTVGAPSRGHAPDQLVVDGRTVAARRERDRLYADGVGSGRHTVVAGGE